MDGMIVGHVIPAVNSGNYPLKERELKVGDELDLVEVIRCKDCIFQRTCIHTSTGIDPDGFCKWGRRKDGDGE